MSSRNGFQHGDRSVLRLETFYSFAECLITEPVEDNSSVGSSRRRICSRTLTVRSCHATKIPD